MRTNLETLIRSTIILKYSLPANSISRCSISNKDDCYTHGSSTDLSKIIYNGIIEYSYDEFELNGDFTALHARALMTRLRYNPDDDTATRMKYGFFGEVLLYSVLHAIYNVPVLISRGHFYLPAENSETKGYDSYHLIEHGGNVELWFGEVKFHGSFKQAIRSALGNLSNVFTDGYLTKRNLVAIFDKVSLNSNYGQSPLTTIINDWISNPNIDIVAELRNNRFKLVYPVFIISNQSSEGYDQSITDWVSLINTEFSTIPTALGIPVEINFIFLPVDSASNIKSQVIQWIESNQPLI